MNEFYALNPRRIERYQPFLMARLKADKDNDSERGWIGGTYVAKAIGAVISKRNKFPESPLRFYSVEEDDEAQPLTDADRFSAYAMAFNAANAGRFKKADTDTKEVKADNAESP